MKLIFDEFTRACLGAVDAPWHGSGIVVEVAALPDDLSILSLSDDGEIVTDETAALARAKSSRIAEIKPSWIGDVYFGGQIAEIIILGAERAPGNAEYDRIYNYLSTKYAIV